jgi:hypothetical protein
MSNERVKPLFEDSTASPELRNFVAVARSDGPSQAELDHLTKRLAPVLGVSAGLAIAGQAAAVGTAAVGTAPAGVLGGSASGVGAAAGGVGTTSVAPAALVGMGAAAAKGGLLGQLLASTSAKVVALGLSVGAAGVGAWQLQAPPPGGPGIPASAPQTPATVVAEPAAPPARAGNAAEPAALDPTPAAPVAEVAQIVVPRSEARGRTAHASGSARPAAAQVAAEPVAASGPVAAAAVPEAQPLPSEVAAVPAVPPPSELALIRRAQAARGDSSLARGTARFDGAEVLALLVQHEQLYPRGALAQEREMLAIETLLKAGQRSQAEARGRRFKASYPGSAHLPHLAALLARAGAK